MIMEEKRVRFGSRIGAILAAAGSAVGLGNIWRFPCETGANGGAAFILVYIVCIMFVALPVLITEMALGRYSRHNVYDTYRMLAPHKWWRAIGMLGVMGGFLVFSYYSVVAGWTLEYTIESGMGNIMGKTPEQYGADFQAFASSPWRPLLCMIVFVIITSVIVILGVKKGIERGSKIMMPLLFVLLLVLMGCSLSLPGAGKGVEFLLKPDFSKVTSDVLLSAMGQAFFTLSVGIGCLMTYASYFSDKVNIVKDSCNVAFIDTCVAILAGLIIFPAAMSVNISPDAGPSLVFITLPNVFQQAFGQAPVLCYVVTLMFYLLLAMAALTSSISMLEITTAFVMEKFGLCRWKSVVVISTLTLLAGGACALSFGPWADVTVFGMGFFDLFDYIVAKFAMPIGGLFSCLMLGMMGKEKVTTILTNGNKLHIRGLVHTLYYVITFIAPILIIVVFLNELGVF